MVFLVIESFQLQENFPRSNTLSVQIIDAVATNTATERQAQQYVTMLTDNSDASFNTLVLEDQSRHLARREMTKVARLGAAFGRIQEGEPLPPLGPPLLEEDGDRRGSPSPEPRDRQKEVTRRSGAGRMEGAPRGRTEEVQRGRIGRTPESRMREAPRRTVGESGGGLVGSVESSRLAEAPQGRYCNDSDWRAAAPPSGWMEDWSGMRAAIPQGRSRAVEAGRGRAGSGERWWEEEIPRGRPVEDIRYRVPEPSRGWMGEAVRGGLVEGERFGAEKDEAVNPFATISASSTSSSTCATATGSASAAAAAAATRALRPTWPTRPQPTERPPGNARPTQTPLGFGQHSSPARRRRQ